jgi:hypothetical protein
MNAICVKCGTLNTFNWDNTGVDYCRKCAATNIMPGFKPYNDKPEYIKKTQPKKKIGTCENCGRENRQLYMQEPDLCAACYVHVRGDRVAHQYPKDTPEFWAQLERYLQKRNSREKKRLRF